MQATTFLLTPGVILLTPRPTLAASGAAMGLRHARLLPLAEALGYALAIAFLLAVAELLAGAPRALPMLKGVAAVWLVVSARKLWSLRPQAGASDDPAEPEDHAGRHSLRLAS